MPADHLFPIQIKIEPEEIEKYNKGSKERKD